MARPPGAVELVSTGRAADGSHAVGQASAQHLVNPRSRNPRSSAGVRDWIRRRVRADPQMRQAHAERARRKTSDSAADSGRATSRVARRL